MRTNWKKYRFLTWKNILLEWRHITQTIIEIILPITFCLVILLVRNLLNPNAVRNTPTHYRAIETSEIYPVLENPYFHITIGYTPFAGVFEEKFELLNEFYGALYNNTIKYQGVANEQDLDILIAKNQVKAGIIFHYPANITQLPLILNYTLRYPSEPPNANGAYWQTNIRFPNKLSINGPRVPTRNDNGLPSYIEESLASIQYAISFSFSQCYDSDFPYIKLRRFPIPRYTTDPLSEVLSTFVSFCVMVSFIYPVMNTVRFIANEKERQSAYLQMMGVPIWLQWTIWFTRSMFLMLITISCMVVVLKASVRSVFIFKLSNGIIIWIFLIFYYLSMITYCFMFATLISNTESAAVAAGFVWFISYFPMLLICGKRNDQLLLISKIIVFLCSNAEMSYGFESILRLESIGKGLQWSNLLEKSDYISFGIAMFSMLMTSCLYFIIALCVQKIRPGTIGEPFTKHLRLRGKVKAKDKTVKQEDDDDDEDDDDNYNSKFEEEPGNRRAIVRIQNLLVSRNNRGTSCRITLNMFEDQIMVLFIRGRASKTALLSMLIGMFSPKSGSVIINGCDIQKDLQKARTFIGLCPRKNILFGELTVCENIILYSRLKGSSYEDGLDEANKYAMLLGLQQHKHTLSGNLSKSQQRMLLVAVALCANSKFVFLYEPSSVLDPVDRRVFYDALQREKKGRTILLTTQFISEAEYLGDRVAVIVDGELKCCGSPFFLKTNFNVDYKLVCVKEPACQSGSVTRTLSLFMPTIKLQSENESVITYLMPNNRLFRTRKVLHYLESESKRLKLSNFGIWLSTLDDVLIKITSDLMTLTKPSIKDNPQVRSYGSISSLRGIRLKINQWHAVLKKKYTFWHRSRLLFIIPILMSSLAIVISVAMFQKGEVVSDLRSLNISLDVYDKTVVMLQRNQQFNMTEYPGMLKTYREIVQAHQGQHTIDEFDEDIESRFLRLSETTIDFNSFYLIGMSVHDEKSVIAWFNNEAIHAIPLTINLILNARMKAYGNTSCTVYPSFSPTPLSTEKRIRSSLTTTSLGFLFATSISLAMAFVSTSYSVFYVKERVSQLTELQYISGVGTLSYWLASFLFDYITYIFTASVIILTIFIFQQDGWASSDELLAVFIILVAFGFATMPTTYALSSLFSILSTACVGLLLIYLFTGVILFVVVIILDVNMSALKATFAIFPHHSLSISINNLDVMNTVERLCQLKCDAMASGCNKELLCILDESCCGKNYYSWNEPGIGRNLMCMFLIGLIFFVILLLNENGYGYIRFILNYLNRKFSKQISIQSIPSDNFDVKVEKEIVATMSKYDLKVKNLVIRDLSKFYGKAAALQQFSIKINQSECLGLFGISGAGKTTAFKVLTGATKITNGDAYVRGVSITKERSTVRKMIGYCPQFNALLDELTGRETLEIFALLRGVRLEDVNDVVDRLVSDLNFVQDIDRQISEYSDGNKRKLCAAVAFIGNPDVIYLDEPTIGMDLDSLNRFRNIVSKLCRSGKSIVLASNSMEDCEALCGRTVILAKGQMTCLTSPQSLKVKYAKGILISLECKGGSEAEVKGCVQSRIPGAKLINTCKNMLFYYIPMNAECKLSSCFGIFESKRKNRLIKSYTVAQTSLEQACLPFT